jgi:hypothetical protein
MAEDICATPRDFQNAKRQTWHEERQLFASVAIVCSASNAIASAQSNSMWPAEGGVYGDALSELMACSFASIAVKDWHECERWYSKGPKGSHPHQWVMRAMAGVAFQ